MATNLRNVLVGTSGWSLSRELAPGSSPELSGLERYAEYFNAVEVNSTFYRLPQPDTIRRWCDATPAEFRFAVKVPRSITHEARLAGVERELEAFCVLCARFEARLGPLLVQLPPSFPFEPALAAHFFEVLAQQSDARIVLEPRHLTWFTADAERLLTEHGIGRVAADPACCEAAQSPLRSRGVTYFRWHGSPRKYFSAYLPESISVLADAILRARTSGGARGEVYCFLDNTALGAASVNALSLKIELTNGPLVRRLRRQAAESDGDCATSPTGRAAR